MKNIEKIGYIKYKNTQVRALYYRKSRTLYHNLCCSRSAKLVIVKF